MTHTPLEQIVADLCVPIGKTLGDVIDVTLDHPEFPSTITIFFNDGTNAVVEVTRPTERTKQ